MQQAKSNNDCVPILICKCCSARYWQRTLFCTCLEQHLMLACIGWQRTPFCTCLEQHLMLACIAWSSTWCLNLYVYDCNSVGGAWRLNTAFAGIWQWTLTINTKLVNTTKHCIVYIIHIVSIVFDFRPVQPWQTVSVMSWDKYWLLNIWLGKLNTWWWKMPTTKATTEQYQHWTHYVTSFHERDFSRLLRY